MMASITAAEHAAGDTSSIRALRIPGLVESAHVHAMSARMILCVLCANLDSILLPICFVNLAQMDATNVKTPSAVSSAKKPTSLI